MDICKNCNGILVDGKHQSEHTKCKNAVVRSLIGIQFLDGYYKFEVVKRADTDGFYMCNGRGNKLKNKQHPHNYIVKNSI